MTAAPRDEQLSFRPMVREDPPHLHDWLEQPHVAEWWDDASETIEGVERLEAWLPSFDPAAAIRQAQNFAPERFDEGIMKAVAL